MLTASDERVAEILLYALNKGDEAARETFDIKDDTLRRYKDLYKKKHGTSVLDSSAALRKIGENYTPAELQAIAKGGRVQPTQFKVPIINFEGDTCRFAFLSDPHMGSVSFVEEFWDKAIEWCITSGVKFIVLGGDVTEGMDMSKEGHLYDLAIIGYKAQRDYAVEQMNKWPGAWKVIDGNHDRWYQKRNNTGAIIVEDICDRVTGAEFLGQNEGHINLQGVDVVPFHGEDGSSYAISYRVQKKVESYTGGEKPQILLLGHCHKQGYFFYRHVHAVSGGAMCKQSRHMRARGLANHMGFHTIDATIRDGQVVRFGIEWFPSYM